MSCRTATRSHTRPVCNKGITRFLPATHTRMNWIHCNTNNNGYDSKPNDITKTHVMEHNTFGYGQINHEAYTSDFLKAVSGMKSDSSAGKRLHHPHVYQDYFTNPSNIRFLLQFESNKHCASMFKQTCHFGVCMAEPTYRGERTCLVLTSGEWVNNIRRAMKMTALSCRGSRTYLVLPPTECV